MSIENILNETQFAHQNWERYSRGVTHRGLEVTARHPKFGEIGRMDLATDSADDGGREILDMGVVFKRRGVGTGMYNYAREAGLEPRHSTWRTDEGDAWARKVGGELPERDDRR